MGIASVNRELRQWWALKLEFPTTPHPPLESALAEFCLAHRIDVRLLKVIKDDSLDPPRVEFLDPITAMGKLLPPTGRTTS